MEPNCGSNWLLLVLGLIQRYGAGSRPVNWVAWSLMPGACQGRAKSVSQVDGISAMAPICWFCVSVLGRAHKRHNGLSPSFCLGESCPPVLALMPDTSGSCKPPVPFKLLPWCWSSERVRLSMFHIGPLRGTARESSSFFHQLQSHWFFSQKLYRLLFLAWNPGLGEQVWGWDPLFLRYPS